MVPLHDPSTWQDLFPWSRAGRRWNEGAGAGSISPAPRSATRCLTVSQQRLPSFSADGMWNEMSIKNPNSFCLFEIKLARNDLCVAGNNEWFRCYSFWAPFQKAKKISERFLLPPWNLFFSWSIFIFVLVTEIFYNAIYFWNFLVCVKNNMKEKCFNECCHFQKFKVVET